MSIIGKLAAQLRSFPSAAAVYLDARLAALEAGTAGLQLASTAPANVTRSAAAIGVSATAAHADHKHDVDVAAPVAVGVANSAGIAASLSCSDHVHANGNQHVEVTLVAGTATVNTLITITANSRVIPVLKTAGAGVSGTRYAISGLTVGGPGVGAFTVTAKDSAAGDNTVATDVSVLDCMIVEAVTAT